MASLRGRSMLITAAGAPVRAFLAFILFFIFGWTEELQPLYSGRYIIPGALCQDEPSVAGSGQFDLGEGPGRFARGGSPLRVSWSEEAVARGRLGPSFLVLRGTSSILSRVARSLTRAAGGTERLLFLTSDQQAGWMTPQDEAGQRLIAQAVSALAPGSPQQVVSTRPLSILDRVLPLDSVFMVESGGPVDSFEPQLFQRKECLGSGSRNLVVAAVKPTPEERPGALSLMKLGTAAPRSAKMVAAVQSLAAKEEPKASQAQHGTREPRPPPHSPSLDRVAIRVAVTTWPPIRTEQEAASYLEKRKAEQQKVQDVLPQGLSPADLESKLGFVVPRHTGRIAGKADLLGRSGQTTVLNAVEVLKPLACDLFTILPRVEDSRAKVFIAKRILQLGAFLEAANLVHRDIKLENILLDTRGQLYITDFDTVVKAGEPLNCVDHPSPGFAPPEVVKCVLDTSQRVLASPRSDAWSIGWLVWEVLCRSQPFELPEQAPDHIRNLGALEYLSSLKEQNTRKVDWSRCRSEVGADLREVVESLLDRNPHTRSSLVEIFTKHALFQRGRLRASTEGTGTSV
ncbi:rhoptry kinase family protein rop39 [Cystoisospora suis]|uniref:non-specific serine/threonine protein kinase n=1 Tax=Cystoisospora suis TaxID=483139 RepID=A0A2C6L7U1_9APIC|nr:rhoptry kinase family protein rop39 [Cystoisospora suis]